MTEPLAAPDRMLKFFSFAHLRADLQPISRPFSDLAHFLVSEIPAGPVAHGRAAQAFRGEGRRGAFGRYAR